MGQVQQINKEWIENRPIVGAETGHRRVNFHSIRPIFHLYTISTSNLPTDPPFWERKLNSEQEFLRTLYSGLLWLTWAYTCWNTWTSRIYKIYCMICHAVVLSWLAAAWRYIGSYLLGDPTKLFKISHFRPIHYTWYSNIFQEIYAGDWHW